MKKHLWFWLTIFAGFTTLSLSAQVVTVSSPTNNSQVSSPVHYLASATSPQCSLGISAMRIYLADHVNGYTVQGGSIDTSLSLAPGNYNTVVQAWDNCGGVAKTAVTITVLPSGLQPVKFLFVGDAYNFKLLGFVVDPATGTVSPTKQGSIATSQTHSLAVDKGGYRLYLADNYGWLYGYFIDRKTGALSPVPGSPVPISPPGGGATPTPVASGSKGEGTITVHPSGKLVFAAGAGGVVTFRVNANGSLTAINSLVPADEPTSSLIVDSTGRYLYSASDTSSTISAFAIDTVSGSLTPVPGSPYAVAVPGCSATPLSMIDNYGRFLYLADYTGSAISGFNIISKTGSLSEIPGSPFLYGQGCRQTWPYSLATEPSGRFLYVMDAGQLSLFSINAGNGVPTFAKAEISFFPVEFFGNFVRLDPSGKFLYFRNTSQRSYIAGYAINPVTGDLTAIPGGPIWVSGADFVLTP